MYMPVKPIAVALREAKTAITQVVLLSAIMDTIMVLLISTLVCVLLTLPTWLALLTAALYALVHVTGAIKQITYNRIEDKVPILKEQLITAADNWKQNNEVTDSLCQDVLKHMKEVKTSYFLDLGKLTRQIAVMAIISFVIIGTSAFNVKFLDFPQVVKDIQEFKPFEAHDINEELLAYEEGTDPSEILGDASVAQLGQEELNLELNPIQSEVDIGSIRDPSEQRFQNVAPKEISASGDSGFEDAIPRQYQRIVKTYFREITKT